LRGEAAGEGGCLDDGGDGVSVPVKTSEKQKARFANRAFH
jgi:hypothetical protein